MRPIYLCCPHKNNFEIIKLDVTIGSIGHDVAKAIKSRQQVSKLCFIFSGTILP
jgi:hypothetical protein